MAEVKMFTHYEFMLIAETENVIISFKVFGEFNSHPCKSVMLKNES